MKINEVARLTGVTVRTLHYYDEIGLLRPSGVTEAGYRVYDGAALETLQQILFFRELDFPLAEIRTIMASPNYDKTEALQKHRELLRQKRARLDGLIALVDSTIKGENTMRFQEFDTKEMEANKKKYAAEVKARWGNTDAYRQSEEKAAGRNQQQESLLHGEGAALLREFGENRGLAPESEQAQRLVARWQAYITERFYDCTSEILSCLGLMYVGDPRFTENIDRNGEGTAAFMAAAIAVYCAK